MTKQPQFHYYFSFHIGPRPPSVFAPGPHSACQHNHTPRLLDYTPPTLPPTKPLPTQPPKSHKTVAFLPVLATMPTRHDPVKQCKPKHPTLDAKPFPLLCTHLKQQGFLTSSMHQSLRGESLPHHQRIQTTHRPHWKPTLPSAHTLRRGPVGAPALNHSFTQEAAFDTISFFVITSSFLAADNIANLSTAHPPLHEPAPIDH